MNASTLSRNSPYPPHPALKMHWWVNLRIGKRYPRLTCINVPPSPTRRLSLLLNLPLLISSSLSTFCVTIFQSIAMFSCQFAKVAILDHYSWSEGSGDEIAEYFKVCALAHALTTSLAHEFKNVSIDSIVLHKVSVRFTPDPCGKEEKALFLFNIFTFIPFPLIPSLPSRPSFPWVWKK